ncbi:MAG: alpha/beta hydrolase [Anaerolinea sp.]|nr:alpha/beta hydrolase [Anaerolinea sp.]
MPSTLANRISIWYEALGDPAGPPVLLVMGQGAQATGWPAPFCQALVAAGLFVIRYDNRDVGYSTWFADGEAYTLEDMAADAVGLLDALGIERCHLVGASLGGAIAQLVAIAHPGRVLSLTSIMASAGRDTPADGGREALLDRFERERLASDAEAIEESVESWRMCAAKSQPFDAEWWREFVTDQHRRRPNPRANAHHRRAMERSGSRLASLAGISTAALVIHGDEDPLVPLSEGEAVARAIPGARLHVVRGMGHELPPRVLTEIAAAIAGFIQEAARSAR